MLKKGLEVRWTDVARKSFESIKKAIMEAPTLIILDYSKEFHIFSFASNDTLAAVLLQADKEGSEHLVAFFSKNLRDAELRYDIIEKRAYALIKSLKVFRVYILHSKIIPYVLSTAIKDVLTQPDADGRRAKWIAKLIEFNIELKPTKLVKENGQTEEEEAAEPEKNQTLAKNLGSCDWYSTIVKLLLKLEIPPRSTQSQAKTIKLRETKYCIYENLLYWRDPSGMLLRCLDNEQSIEVMKQFHSSMCGGHHCWKTTSHKILRAGYYWPSLFSNVFLFVKSCDRCQRFEGKQQLKSLPLKPIHAKGPFQQWGLDFIGEINPHSSGQHRWILVTTDYFTKWIEAIPTRKADHMVVMKFLIENIFTRFGFPHKLVTYNAVAFRAKELVEMCDSMGIKLIHSTSYYPQGNGLAESSNKSLIRIIKKLLEDNKKNWDSKLKYALWADRVTIKKSTGNSPFKLVYGIEAVFSIQLTLPVGKFLQ
eukprot:PITA_11220